jgi:hypothetical protein
VRRLDVDELEYVENVDMEGILGGLGSNSEVGPSLEPGEALRFLELAFDLVKVWQETPSFSFFSRRREDLLVAAGVEEVNGSLLLIFASLGSTFSSNKDVDVEADVLDGSVLLRAPSDDDDVDDVVDGDRIGRDADLHNMILLRLISPRAPI